MQRLSKSELWIIENSQIVKTYETDVNPHEKLTSYSPINRIDR